MPDLSGVSHFERGKGQYKYRAVLKNGKTVSFGARGYEHFKDSVPKNMGGGLYSHLDHKDQKRRNLYRIRHSAVYTSDGKLAHTKKYSPAWFSWHFLW